MISQPPEVVRIIAVGSLEAYQLIFLRKKDRRTGHQDQLLAKRIEAKDVDIGGPDGATFTQRENP